jgi:hypothetical protein
MPWNSYPILAGYCSCAIFYSILILVKVLEQCGRPAGKKETQEQLKTCRAVSFGISRGFFFYYPWTQV